MHIAFFGPRRDLDDLEFIKAIGVSLVRAGHTVHNTSSNGAEIAMNAAIGDALREEAAGGCEVHFPWSGFEEEAARMAGAFTEKFTMDTRRITKDEITAGMRAHTDPNPPSDGFKPIYGRNARVLYPFGLGRQPVNLVIAYSKTPDRIAHHGLQLAKLEKIPIHDLSDPDMRARYQSRLAEQQPA